MIEIPEYWKSELLDIEEVFSHIKKGKTSLIGKSAGGRPIYSAEYGTPNEDVRTANYVSAAGGKKLACYKNHKKPCVLLVGSIHGAEFEGIVSLLNLINVFETGKDFKGISRPELESWKDRAHIVIIPAINPDGRARVPYKSVVGMEISEFRRYAQGVWNDGSTCDWPQCKQIHPIKGHVKYMGGYFNDDGVNLMCDNFFSPMAEETSVLLKQCDFLAADAVILLHGHAETGYCGLIPAQFEVDAHTRLWAELENRLDTEFEKIGSRFVHSAERMCKGDERAFSLTDACCFSCGALATVLESDQGVVCCEEDKKTLHIRHDIILESHMTFYRELDSFLHTEYIGKERLL